MGHIYFRLYYTELVEHYFRMAVCFENVGGDAPASWHRFTRDWITKQSERDQHFIRFIFGKEFFNSKKALEKFSPFDNMDVKRLRLCRLEKRFAIDAELIPVFSTISEEN